MIDNDLLVVGSKDGGSSTLGEVRKTLKGPKIRVGIGLGRTIPLEPYTNAKLSVSLGRTTSISEFTFSLEDSVNCLLKRYFLLPDFPVKRYQDNFDRLAGFKLISDKRVSLFLGQDLTPGGDTDEVSLGRTFTPRPFESFSLSLSMEIVGYVSTDASWALLRDVVRSYINQIREYFSQVFSLDLN